MEKTEKMNKGKIYKLYVVDPPWFYFGSTTQHHIMARRLQHKQRAQQCPDNQMYKILNNIGWDKIKIDVIEEMEFTHRRQLTAKENEYIKANIEDPYLLNKQYSCLDLTNFDNYNKYTNRDKSKVQNTWETDYLLKQQEYRRKVKDYKKQYDKEYRKNNSEYIKQRRSTHIQCPCGITSTVGHYKRHQMATHHQNYLNNINTSDAILSKQD